VHSWLSLTLGITTMRRHRTSQTIEFIRSSDLEGRGRFHSASSSSLINVKKTTVYTHVNGDRPSHIENSKNKKVIITISLHIVVRQCAAV